MNKQSWFWVLLFITFGIYSSFKISDSKKERLDPKTTIIILPQAPDALEKEAAITLNKWLKKIYKTEFGFNIIADNILDETNYNIIISIGHTRYCSFQFDQKTNPNSFILNKNDKFIEICGNSPIGTLMGTGYFLDRFCGIRMYLPTDLFTSLPSKEFIELSEKIYVKEDSFTKYVSASGFKGIDVVWGRINGLIRKDWESHQHSMGARFFNEDIIKKFPAIFPTYNGKKYFPSSPKDQNWQPDFAEPQLVDAAVETSIEYFKNNPLIDYISFSVQDSPKYPTEGKMGAYLAKYPQTKEGLYQGYSDAFHEFLNKLSRKLRIELPKNGINTPKTIVYIAYGKVNQLPKERLDPMILPITTLQIAESLKHDMLNPNMSKYPYYQISQWAKKTNRLGNHDWAEGNGFLYPRIYTNLHASYLKTIKKENLQFEYAHIETYPNWGLDGPKYYFMSKLLWNPSLNADSLLSLFCKDMFGSAERDMKNYFLTIEKLSSTINNSPNQKREMGDYKSQLVMDKTELSLIRNARKHLDNAMKKAKPDLVKQRIRLFSNTFKITENFIELFNSEKIDPNKIKKLKDDLALIDGNNMTFYIAAEDNFIEQMDKIINMITNVKKRKL